MLAIFVNAVVRIAFITLPLVLCVSAAHLIIPLCIVKFCVAMVGGIAPLPV
jgi:hypothetical protein